MVIIQGFQDKHIVSAIVDYAGEWRTPPSAAIRMIEKSNFNWNSFCNLVNQLGESKLYKMKIGLQQITFSKLIKTLEFKKLSKEN